MRFGKFSFGSIRIDGVTCEHDVITDRGQVRSTFGECPDENRFGSGARTIR
jgi:hypothetical protein